MRTWLCVCSPTIHHHHHTLSMGWKTRIRRSILSSSETQLEKNWVEGGECRSEAFTSPSLFPNRIEHCLTSFYHYFHIQQTNVLPSVRLSGEIHATDSSSIEKLFHYLTQFVEALDTSFIVVLLSPEAFNCHCNVSTNAGIPSVEALLGAKQECDKTAGRYEVQEDGGGDGFRLLIWTSMEGWEILRRNLFEDRW